MSANNDPPPIAIPDTMATVARFTQMIKRDRQSTDNEVELFRLEFTPSSIPRSHEDSKALQFFNGRVSVFRVFHRQLATTGYRFHYSSLQKLVLLFQCSNISSVAPSQDVVSVVGVFASIYRRLPLYPTATR